MVDISKVDSEADDAGTSTGILEQESFQQVSGLLAKVRLARAKQTVLLRTLVTIAAGFLVLAAVWLEWILLDYLMCSNTSPSDNFVFLAIAPIASITVIVAYLLGGVFRSNKDLMDAAAEVRAKGCWYRLTDGLS